MDKKGDKIISVYWFAVLVIIAGGIFAMVSTFYHHPYDIRGMEANIMINKIADCLSDKGYLKEEIITYENGIGLEEDFTNNFLRKCNLNFNVEDEWEELQYYIEVNFYDIQDMSNSLFSIFEGNKNLISSCEIQEDKEHERLAKCVERRFYSLDEKDNQHLIKILSIVRKTEKNVK